MTNVITIMELMAILAEEVLMIQTMTIRRVGPGSLCRSHMKSTSEM